MCSCCLKPINLSSAHKGFVTHTHSVQLLAKNPQKMIFIVTKLKIVYKLFRAMIQREVWLTLLNLTCGSIYGLTIVVTIMSENHKIHVCRCEVFKGGTDSLVCLLTMVVVERWWVAVHLPPHLTLPPQYRTMSPHLFTFQHSLNTRSQRGHLP